MIDTYSFQCTFGSFLFWQLTFRKLSSQVSVKLTLTYEISMITKLQTALYGGQETVNCFPQGRS